jgi:hypothetical protein
MVNLYIYRSKSMDNATSVHLLFRIDIVDFRLKVFKMRSK